MSAPLTFRRDNIVPFRRERSRLAGRIRGYSVVSYSVPGWSPGLLQPNRYIVPFRRIERMSVPVMDQLRYLVFDGTTVTSGAPEIISVGEEYYVAPAEVRLSLDRHPTIESEQDFDMGVTRAKDYHVER